MKNDIAVIIPTYNRVKYLSKLVSDLSYQSVKSFIIIIVDASNNCNIKNYLKKLKMANLRYLRVNSGKFWTGTINQGIKYTQNIQGISGVVLLNDDVRIRNDFIENIQILKEKHSRSLIGCVNIDVNDKNTILWAGIKTNKWLAITKYLYKNQSINNINTQQIIESFTLIGRGLYIPMEAFNKVGYFDEKHIPHRGDTEFPLRARKINYKLIVSLLPIVYIYNDETYKYDFGKTKLKDFKKVFFDFRSSSYIKTRFYYAKSATNNKLQFLTFFSIEMLIHLRRFILRLF